MKALGFYSLSRELLNRQLSGFVGSISLPYARVSRRETVKFEYSRTVQDLELEIKQLQLKLKALKKREEDEGIAFVASQSNILTITPITSVWSDDQVSQLDTLVEGLKLLGGGE